MVFGVRSTPITEPVPEDPHNLSSAMETAPIFSILSKCRVRHVMEIVQEAITRHIVHGGGTLLLDDNRVA